jgi:alkylation response protein AidB-like acyl-CoA dehydrogenase
MTFDFRAAAEAVAAVAREHAIAVDSTASFPTATVDAARKAGLFGLISGTDVGGHGLSLRAATRWC